jgi:hypothetical protein
MVQFPPVEFVHFVTYYITKQGTHCGPDQCCFGAAADSLPDERTTCPTDTDTLLSLSITATGTQADDYHWKQKQNKFFHFQFSIVINFLFSVSRATTVKCTHPDEPLQFGCQLGCRVFQYVSSTGFFMNGYEFLLDGNTDGKSGPLANN